MKSCERIASSVSEAGGDRNVGLGSHVEAPIPSRLTKLFSARVAELEYATALGAVSERIAGSTPVPRTIEC